MPSPVRFLRRSLRPATSPASPCLTPSPRPPRRRLCAVGGAASSEGEGRGRAAERWQRAARRAIAEWIEVRQINANGMWVTNSGTQGNVAYMLEIVAGVVQACTCPAGEFGDPCCKHAASCYLAIGVLEVDDDPEPDLPAMGATITCRECSGGGLVHIRDCARAGWPHPNCPSCQGTGATSVSELRTPRNEQGAQATV
jgi:hypothetical protein